MVTKDTSDDIYYDPISNQRAAGLVLYRCLCGEIQYLLLKASYGDRHWSSPKGHVDPGEDDFATALRETEEEAGYTPEDLVIYKDVPKTLYYEVNGKAKEVIYWLAKLKDPNKEPILSDEHTEMKWLPKEQAKNIIGFKDNQQMIDEFHDFILKQNCKT